MSVASLPICYGIIPARYGSTRFPGKPLADIRGKPMFWHVYQQAMKCPELAEVVIATDDDRIASAAQSLDVPVVMTRSDHRSGTDRVWEAAGRMDAADSDVIVNIQGDEPLLEPAMLSTLIAPLARPDVSVTTLAHRMDRQFVDNPDRVKVVFSADGRALYFSRAPVPYAREGVPTDYFCHIGLYAFRKTALDRFVSLKPGQLEQIEKLEQLRLLENNVSIHVAVTELKSISVDRPEDIERVLDILNTSGGE